MNKLHLFTWMCGVVFTWGGFVVKPRSQAPGFWMIGIIFLTVAIVWTVANSKKRIHRNQAMQNLEYDSQNYILKVSACSAINADSIAIEAISKDEYKYQLFYSGGYEAGYFPIKKVRLTDELARKAKDQPVVRDFLKGNELILEHADDQLSSFERDAYQDYLRNNMQSIMNNRISNTTAAVVHRLTIGKQLTKEECVSVRNWLISDNV